MQNLNDPVAYHYIGSLWKKSIYDIIFKSSEALERQGEIPLQNKTAQANLEWDYELIYLLFEIWIARLTSHWLKT